MVSKHMFHHLAAAVAVLLVVGLDTPPASAQLFGGSRQLGTPLQRRQSPGLAGQATQDAGEVQGNERFLRSNRRRGDFVGSDRFERRSFVGAQQGQAAGPVIPSTLGVRPEIDRSSQINQPLPAPGRNQAYYPRLTLGFATHSSPMFRPEKGLQRELANPDYFSSSNRFEVSVEVRTATLRGVVADARERDLAELLVSFEPGISAVRNELRVQAPANVKPQTESAPVVRPPAGAASPPAVPSPDP